MGVLLFDKNADFSAVSLGHAGLYTSVTANLQGLFELRRSLSKARLNSAPANDVTASFSNSPVFNATSMDLTAAGQAVFPTGPSNGGENTVAMIVKVKNGGSTASAVIGSIPGSQIVNGSAYLVHYNRRFQFYTTLFNAQTAPATYSAQPSAYFDVSASLDGTFQLIVVTLKSQDALKMYLPATGVVATTTFSAGQYAYFNQGVTGSNWQSLPSAVNQQGVAMFANWDRALSAGEVTTFYGEMKKQFGLIGLVI